jgi:hypothetical protein
MQARPPNIKKILVIERPYIRAIVGDKLHVIFPVNSVEQNSPLWFLLHRQKKGADQILSYSIF